MALVAERWGLIPELKAFAASDRPIWGTCAGLIFLANRASGQKSGGQALLGGLDCNVHRNFFGAQINSFEARLPSPACLPPKDLSNENSRPEPFRAIFIRAPAITEVGSGVEVLAEYNLTESEKEAVMNDQAYGHGRAETLDRAIVAVRQGRLLATSFHPELTDDVRWHKMFVDMVRDYMQKDDGIAHEASSKLSISSSPHDVAEKSTKEEMPLRRPVNRPGDLPVYT